MKEAYFFDTYAIIEIIKGNKNYEKFKEAKLAITIFNITELHYSLLRDFSQNIAGKFSNKYWDFVVDLNLDLIKEANYFKLKHKNTKFSAADVIGYITAKRLGVKFLTGDNDFKGMSNVEFIK